MEEPVAEQMIEAEYTLESRVICPNCQEGIESIHVVRMLRTKVNFVSGLPRRAQILVCPECKAVLAAYLGSLI
jgi:hypothetical protein